MKFPYLPEEEIDAAADNLLRDAFGSCDDVPLPVDLDVIAYDYLYEREDVSFRDDQQLGAQNGEEILGITQPRRRKIFVDSVLKKTGPVGRYRFTVAHEIGHWVLHAPLYTHDEAQRSLFEDERERDDELVSLRRDVFPKAKRGRLPPEEWQANRFAIALLIDPDRLREEFRARFDLACVTPQDLGEEPTAVGRRRAARSLATEPVNQEPPLASVFGLSAEAMAIALEKRGYLRKDTAAL